MQNISVIEAPPSIIAVLTTRCAWCQAEQGIPAGEGSHGICRPHADELLAKWKAQRKMTREDIERIIRAQGYNVTFPSYVPRAGNGTETVYVSAVTRGSTNRKRRNLGVLTEVEKMSQKALVALIRSKFEEAHESLSIGH